MNDYDPNFKPVKSYFIVGQKAIIRNESGYMLLLQRSEKSGAGGKWSLPGGALENGESHFSGIEREITEETSLQVEKLRPFTLRSYKNGEDSVIIVGYECVAKTTEVTLNWEHTEYEWISKEDALKKDLTDDARFLIEHSLKQIV
ncbi:NUDIX domain-containing protein [Candidatus Woesebacteria bacterium]|nr:NUDIX domain-containing protein [Candidatus Woesebacteria bacterium]